MRIPDITLVDVPQPFFIPERVQSEGEVTDVEDDLPGVLAELDEGGGLVLAATEAPPALDLALRDIELLS